MQIVRFFALALALLLIAPQAQAQTASSATRSLRILVNAFQNCGPPQAYQRLSPQLFQTIAYQTGGSGCYWDIRNAGPIEDMEVLDQQQFPNGTMFIIRVTHPYVEADWFIGINRYNSMVEFLTFQPASDLHRPSLEDGPDPGSNGPGSVEPERRREPRANDDPGCELYPAMCA